MLPPFEANVGINHELNDLQRACQADIVAMAVGVIAVRYVARLVSRIDLNLPARHTAIGNPGDFA